MLKYVDTKIVFAEIPDEITLAISISGCPCHCEGCHSAYLAEDIGKVLTISRIEKLIEENKGITCICFMGGDNDPKLINHYAHLIKAKKAVRVRKATITKNIAIPEKNLHYRKGDPVEIIEYVDNCIKVGWYSGRQDIAKEIDIKNFDYIKVGPYNKELGPLNKRTTNQVFYKVVHHEDGDTLVDITHRFWKNETED